jgi:phenylalanyl-tRNA synthetase beta chain
MPTITIKKKDLETLIGRPLPPEKLSRYLNWVKGEAKEYSSATDELRIELNDTNRPDLWSGEGIARQIRTKLTGRSEGYSFLRNGKRKHPQVLVSKGLRSIRPYVGACLAKGLTITDETLVQLIQTQEKLADNFGRKRRLVSIGLYRLERIKFPVFYSAVGPAACSFVPLGMAAPMTLQEILEQHPKGKEYGAILAGVSFYPLLMDQDQKILSFPPIINSREVGEVKVGDRDLFVEVTGTDLRMVILTINILAADLSDRGATIEPVEIRFPFKTAFGRRVVMPYDLTAPVTVSVTEVEAALGEKVTKTELKRLLVSYGYQLKSKGKRLEARPPLYRDDVMHPVDLIEDVAISRGYDRFKPILPERATVGSLSALELFSDQIREMLIGFGFQEIISNILCSRTELADRMGLQDAELVEIENVMSQQYNALRNSIFPSLLRVEAASSKAFYPHRIFEIGEVVSREPGSNGSRDLRCLGALLSHPSANFSELHSFLDLLFYYLGREYRLEPAAHPSFIDGRVGRILVGEGSPTGNFQGRGIIGELHPQVLENWQITMPCTAFELELDSLYS